MSKTQNIGAKEMISREAANLEDVVEVVAFSEHDRNAKS
jgi:hypothetical protein